MSSGRRTPGSPAGPPAVVRASVLAPLVCGALFLLPPPVHGFTPSRDPRADAVSDSLVSLHPEGRIALLYTPILRPATDEVLYPVIPHAFAFDGRDNDGDGLIDLADPSELAVGLFDLRTINALHGNRRPFRVTIQDDELTQRIRSRGRDSTWDAWPLPQSTHTALRSAGIEFSPRAFACEPDVSDSGAVAYIVNPERGLTVSAGLSDRIRVDARTGGSPLPGSIVRALQQQGLPLTQNVSARTLVRRDARPPDTLLVIEGDLPWNVTTSFVGYPGSGGRLDLYKDLDTLCSTTRGLHEHLYHEPHGVVSRGSARAPRTQGAVVYELRHERPNGAETGASTLILTRLSDPPEPRVGFRVRGGAPTGGDEISYWLYFLYDIGGGAHVHDAEHAIAYTDAVGDVAAFAADAHGDAAAANIVLRDRGGQLAFQRPQHLPQHMPVLIELGKHALAPDRNDDGRFDLGMDANYGYRAAWGQRDVGPAFGIDELGPFQSAFSFPRRDDRKIVDRLSALKGAAVPAALADPRADSAVGGTFPWGFESRGLYSLYPSADFQALDDLLRGPETGRSDVLEFFRLHHDCFWGARAGDYAIPDSLDTPSWNVLQAWVRTPVVRRDYWTHPSYLHPERVFKPWLFSRIVFIAGLAENPPHQIIPLGIQVPAPRSPFAIEAIRLMVDRDLQDDAFRDIRLMFPSGRGSIRSISGGIGRAGKFSDPARWLFALEYSPAAVAAPHVLIQHLRIAPVGGVRTAVGSGPSDWRFHAGIQVEIPLLGPPDPLRSIRP